MVSVEAGSAPGATREGSGARASCPYRISELLLVVVTERHADAKLDRVERLGADALVAIGNENLNISIGVPAVHCERFIDWIHQPVMPHLVMMVRALLLDQTVAFV